jgi:hypothetical protein
LSGNEGDIPLVKLNIVQTFPKFLKELQRNGILRLRAIERKASDTCMRSQRPQKSLPGIDRQAASPAFPYDFIKYHRATDMPEYHVDEWNIVRGCAGKFLNSTS